MREIESTEGLTNQVPKTYPKGGDIVMEGSIDGENNIGEGEAVKGSEKPVKEGGTKQKESESRNSEQAEKPKNEESVSKERQAKARELLKKTNQGLEVPLTDEDIDRLAKKGLTPVGGGADPEEPPQPPPTTNMFDAVLRTIHEGYARRSRKGLIDVEGINAVVKKLEERAASEGISEQDRVAVAEIIDQLENELVERMRRENIAREAVNRETIEQRKKENDEREKEMAEREYGSAYTEEEMILDKAKRDEAFNNLFAGVDSNPHSFFREAFNPFTYGAQYERFMDLVRNASIGRGIVGRLELSEDNLQILKKQLAADFQRYQTDRRVRESLHDMNAILYLPSVKADQLYDSMQNFSSDLADFALKSSGVREMMDLYEASLRESMMDNDGYLRPEAVLGEVHSTVNKEGKEIIARVDKGGVERITKERFIARLKKRQIITRAENGKYVSMDEKTPDWVVDRTFTTARGMMIITQRLLSLAAESKLAPGNGQYTSLFLQDIVQTYSPYIHLLAKYGVTESGLAAYLYKDEDPDTFFKVLKTWNPRKLKQVLDEFKDKPLDAIYSHKDFVYLMRGNPNRAGDIFTHLSWRVGEDPAPVSMTQRFIEMGEERMRERLKSLGKTLSEEEEKEYVNEYANWIGTALRLERLRGKGGFGEVDLESLSPEFKKLRHEFNSPDFHESQKAREELNKHTKGKKEEDRSVAEAILNEEKRLKILKQMATLQPHRLYLISEEIRQRVDALTEKDTDFQLLKERLVAKEKIDHPEKDQKIVERDILASILDNLALVEGRLLQNREQLLERGETFDTVSLDEFFTEITDSNQRQLAKIFSQIVSEDFELNKNAESRAKAFREAKTDADRKALESRMTQNTYYDEFVRRREYMHAFVLWSGDAPLEEFNASAIGPTGIARRARDNKAQGKAIGEEIKLLANLKNIKSPEDLVKAFQAIYDPLAEYDSGKAKQAIAEKAEGIIKFFLGDTKVNIPIFGQLMEQTARGSMAQMVYGRMAPVWHSSEVRHLLIELHHKQLITEESFQDLTKKLTAGPGHQTLDISSTMAQFAAIALLLYALQKGIKDK